MKPPNPPTPADRLAAIKACATARYGIAGPWTDWNDTVLTALLAAYPPGATVTVLCGCGHRNDSNHSTGECINYGPCDCTEYTPTTARVSYTRALTEEERTR